MITSVKQLTNGYLVNSSLRVPDDPDNRHFQEVQEWIAAGNVPEPEFTLDEKRRNKAAKVRSVAKSRRDQIIPEEDLIRVMAEQLRLVRKSNPTTQDQDRMVTNEGLLDRIIQVYARRSQLEQAALTSNDPDTVDPAEGWEDEA